MVSAAVMDQPIQPETAPGESSHSPDADPASQPLSKKAQKKLAKAARIAEHKKERRAAEKERKKEKKRILAEKRAAGELDETDEQGRAAKKRRTGDGPKKMFGARVVVDLGFDDMMTENEVKSLTSQLAYTYSANRRAERPFASLLFTSLNGRTLTRLEAMSDAAYKRWIGAEWWTEGYERLWDGAEMEETAPEETASGETVEEHRENANADGSWRVGRKKQPASAPRESVVYLTADSSDELTELKEDETYIIGGICDHNRYKNLCLNKSRDTGIRSARLPIGTYLSELRTRKVLTVNQTVDILLRWVETRDWEQALWTVIPRRKFQEGRKRGRGGKGGEEGGKGGVGEDGEGEDEDDMDEDVGAEVVIDEQLLEEAEDIKCRGEGEDTRAANDAELGAPQAHES